MNFTRILQPLMLVAVILISFSAVEFGLPWALLLIAIVGVREISAKKTLNKYSLSTLMLVYLFWLFFVTYFSQVNSVSMTFQVILAGMPVVYLVATNMKSYTENWKVLRIIFFLLGIVFALWGVWQVYAHIGRGHAIGPLVDRNAFAALVNLLWFPTTYLFLAKEFDNKRWLRIVFGVGLFIMSLALFATASRGGIGTWLLLLPIVLWAGYKYKKSKYLVMLIPLIAVLAYFTSTNLLNTSIADRTFAVTQDSSTTARLDMWKSSIIMAKENPLIGTGWGTWGYFYPAFRLHSEDTTAGFFAHNDYLQFASEGGIVALILLSGILLSVLILLKRNLLRASEDEGFESLTLLLGVLAIGIHAGVNFIFYFAFMNVVAGLYLARASQLSDKLNIIIIPSLETIRLPIKRFIFVLLIISIAMPYFLRQFSEWSFYGSRPALKAINFIVPSVTLQDIAIAILVIRPKEQLAQDVLLQIDEQYLAQSVSMGMSESTKVELLQEAIARFDLVRMQNANKPNIGLREVELLMKYHFLMRAGSAYEKAYDVLQKNFRADPHHAKSMIALSRLQVAEGHKEQAIATLQNLQKNVITRRDEQLITIEILRQIAAPVVFVELDDLEKKLVELKSDAEAGYVVVNKDDFYIDVDVRLTEIAKKIQYH